MNAVIVGGLRTPVGRYGGALAGVRPDDLAAHVVRGVVEAAGIDPEEVDEVILGNANGAGEENRNVARMAWLLAGFPDSVPGLTINRLCASGMSAIALARAMILAGDAEVIVAGGVESMSRAPWVLAKPGSPWARPGEIADTSIGWRFTNPVFQAQPELTLSMPETAEEVARRCAISREDADLFALRSHERALAARQAGLFGREILPVEVPTRAGTVLVSDDEGPRPDTSLEKLSRLAPVVRGGEVVTAGNSSSLNDGASALLITSERAAERLGLTPRARIVGSTNVGLEPAVMGLGPIGAVRALACRTGWGPEEADAIELNEAFATQSLACLRELHLDPEITNAWGGAIALGHPLGSSGSRIALTLLSRLEHEGGRRGIATMCVGVGQGSALALERIE
ncbi:thiolase family protein [Corynebacterium uropygiale]|uniref:Probable acetyl-CoA acetyltransferase n=1 Tax=Corynebacterium uropygiale TaxID=1775911 RepID=A0A9X1TYT9_9CORY|nr:thiolase family protein [Corynebacterium uropygiale]MCF4007670.1 thiolase family protein [Corynebacterium uropygiale]